MIGILKGCSCLNCITQRECCSVRQEATTTKTLLRRRRRMKTVTATYRCCDCRIHLVSSSDSSWLVTATHHQLDSCTHFRKVMTKRSRFCISICTRHKLDLVSDDFLQGGVVVNRNDVCCSICEDLIDLICSGAAKRR